ncbi:hypothetical protein Q787_00450 [Ornithobacterium rhinotracheale H06-030791]|nr:hypothetical protein Q785_00500 [Ornithobacterium rhinotracheale ORT-UMN 88]KGB67748.1 hypothetical protein Q787_00450 [Ornithobacterium rhinotracheale H06-030791]
MIFQKWTFLIKQSFDFFPKICSVFSFKNSLNPINFYE